MVGSAGHYFLFPGCGSCFLSLSLSFLSGKWELIEIAGGKPAWCLGMRGAQKRQAPCVLSTWAVGVERLVMGTREPLSSLHGYGFSGATLPQSTWAVRPWVLAGGQGAAWPP